VDRHNGYSAICEGKAVLTANIGSLRRPLTDDPGATRDFSELATILPNSAGKHAAAGEIYRLACDIGNRQFRLK
jgi:hypothetical protein